MSNETKRDVLVNAVDALADAQASSDNNVGLGHQDADLFMAEYEKALPDDLPVVSKDVSNTMITYRFIWWKEFLDKAYDNEFSDDEDINYRIRSESAEVARALILGVWRVEETGEIVKLEEEK
jgi:hypothetical protein